MAEYIDREALLAKLRRVPAFERSETDKGMFYIERSIIDCFPTSDVVEVVRCKDCEYSRLYCGSYICDNVQTPWFNDEFNVDVGSNDFCSYGERKEGAEE